MTPQTKKRNRKPPAKKKGPPKKMGRPTKLTQEVVDKLCDFLRIGGYLEHACGYAGITNTIVYAWRDKGLADEAKGVKSAARDFLGALTRATTEGQAIHLAAIASVGKGEPIRPTHHPRDARISIEFLGRRYPEFYGRKERLELGGAKDAAPIRLAIYLPKEDD